MPLGVFPCFVWVFENFWREIAKRRKKIGNLSKKIGLLRHNVGNPRRDVALSRSMGCPRRGEAEVPKRAPLGYTTA